MSFDFILYTVYISPHQLPLMRMIVERLGKERCLYIYSDKLENGRRKLGWSEDAEPWLFYEKESPLFCREALERCKVLMSGIRDFSLFERRASQNKTTLYSSERWFKPIPVSHKSVFPTMYIPGWLKLIHPTYFRMVRRFRRLLVSQADNSFFYFPISMNAARDVALICSGHRKIDFQRVAGGEVSCEQSEKITWKKRLRLWGYFVESSIMQTETLGQLRTAQRLELKSKSHPLRILWVGRMLALKNVDTIVRAIRILKNNYSLNVSLTLVGDGPGRNGLLELAKELPVVFLPFVPIAEVRTIMREHDLYVFASNSFDGWGAVVSEALEEQMPVLASRQSGAGSTILPEECLFDCNDANKLAERILDFENLPQIYGSSWSTKAAAEYLLQNFLK